MNPTNYDVEIFFFLSVTLNNLSSQADCQKTNVELQWMEPPGP